MEVLLGLAGCLQVGVLGNALPRQTHPEFVVHHLDFLVHQDVGELHGRVGHGVFDEPVCELVPGPVQGVALEPLLHLRPQRR